MLLLQFCVLAQEAQGLRCSVGAMTKYTGSSSSGDAQLSKDSLATLETQLAAAFAKSSELQYLDRSNLDEIFRELHVSSTSLFNASSGALRGLLGRLDYLIVAESSSPTLSRVRVLDVETGAVKMAAFCQARTPISGGASSAEPDCISSILARTSELGKACLTLKRQRLMKAAADGRAAAAKRAEQERQRVELEKQQGRIAAQKEAELFEQQEAADRQRAEEERASRERQAEIDRQIEATRPAYDDAVARLSTETAFWEKLSEQLRRQGLGLRGDVQSALTGARTNASRCSKFLEARKPDELKACVDDLGRKVDQLERYR